ncbi:hypothetical protein DSECCO2_383220 [anaerobic digester metagenome]
MESMADLKASAMLPELVIQDLKASVAPPAMVSERSWTPEARSLESETQESRWRVAASL